MERTIFDRIISKYSCSIRTGFLIFRTFEYALRRNISLSSTSYSVRLAYSN
jgi:hypothetical protein